MSVPGATNIVPCPCVSANCVSTIFIFDNVQYQNSANTVYNRQQAFNEQPKNVVKGRKFTFKKCIRIFFDNPTEYTRNTHYLAL